MVDENLAYASAYEVRELVSNGQLSPVELTQLFFDRIEKLDSQLNAYLTLNYDEAMRQARDAEAAVARGDELGPLHGVPISIKDLELTKGIRTTSGSLHFKDRVPDEDSIVVERVRRASTLEVPRIDNKWAGLRSFVADRNPVVGFDPLLDGFFWLAGQGGYGIQTAPSMGRLSSALATGGGIPGDLARLGVAEAALSPGRFARGPMG